MEELVTLIDEHTEYFRGHLEALAKTERRIYVSVIDLWQPSKPREIAARARMDIRVVSTMLGRLVDRGAVIVEGSGRKRLYAAAERLYCIYYKLRRERDEAAVVRNLIHFMAVFYSEAELCEMSGKLIAEGVRSPAIRKGIEWAIAEMPQVDSVFSIMARPSMEGPSDQTAAINNGWAEQLFQKIAAAFEARTFEKTIEMVDKVFASQSVNWSLMPPPLIGRAFLMKAVAHKALGDSEAAIATFDEVIERFGASEAPEIQVLMAVTLFCKGVTRGDLGDFEAAIATFDELIERFGASEAPEIQLLMAVTLFCKGVARGELGEPEAAIAAFDEVIKRLGARVGASEAPEIQVLMVRALLHKGVTQLGEPEAAIAAFDEVIKRLGALGASEAPEIQVLVARAFCYKGFARVGLGDSEAAIAAFDEALKRLGALGASEAPEIQVLMVRALFCKGFERGELGEPEAAIAAFDELIERFGASEAPEIQVMVARALGYKGVRQTEIRRAEEALHTCEELERRLGTLTGNEEIEFTWCARRVRTKALLVQEKTQAAMDAFRFAYAVFVPGNKKMMREMLRLCAQLGRGWRLGA